MLKQSFPDTTVFYFSKGGKQLKSTELVKNLIKLIEAAQEAFNEVEILYNPKLLVGKQIRHRFMDEDGSLTWYDGLIFNLTDEETITYILSNLQR